MLEIVLAVLVMIGLFVFYCDVTDARTNMLCRLLFRGL
jgi:hypothetical protein